MTYCCVTQKLPALCVYGGGAMQLSFREHRLGPPTARRTSFRAHVTSCTRLHTLPITHGYVITMITILDTKPTVTLYEKVLIGKDCNSYRVTNQFNQLRIYEKQTNK